ncbi:hypothetical protein PV08_04964 [Exophiala spinifera]|uniref:GST N-terminal domain-containing protein n=1 Tax=Exophiala spinifera TaxID=91928 RepID=A0A0D2C285_9EURO|nr:uncharacterized protein PV08_04964 [Exophiala spinifera]KIW17769.1 hypothetical protein PV08_04964 [Exophiala spinifera]
MANATTTTTTNGHSASTPEIILYTNYSCPWAHRAHVVLRELGLPYKEEIIDLDRPRDPWYLKVNPRGLVPSINYNGEIITESAIVAGFLADAHPSHLIPPSSTDPLHRARLAFFVDTFFTKAIPKFFATQRAEGAAAKEAAAEEFAEILAKEQEPLFTWDVDSSAPFFGGSERLTLAEALTAPFVLRLIALSKPEYDLVTPKIVSILESKTPKFAAWAQKVVKEESVTYIFDEKSIAERTKARFAKLAAAEKKL